jgi:ankyrin repeat protein
MSSPIEKEIKGGKLETITEENVNELDMYERPAIFYAISVNNYEIVSELIKLGAKIDTRDKHGKTLLYYAKNIKMLKLLVEPIVDTENNTDNTENTNTNTDNTENTNTNENNNTKKINLKIINQQDKSGNTLLHYAYHESNYEIVNYLESIGSEKTIKNTHGFTPYEMDDNNDIETTATFS